MVKGSILQEDITIVNTYTSNMSAPIYIKQILTELKEKYKKEQYHIFING